MAKHSHPNFILLGLTLGLVSCAQLPWTRHAPASAPVVAALPPLVFTAPEAVQAPEVLASPPEQPAAPSLVSNARTPKDYRADAAKHLYEMYQHRIYKGKLPPMLKAVGVVEVAVDSRGQVEDIVWLRAPRHVPEVMREIETALRQAAPYPAPVHMKHVKYTDTWLWHASGRFQLDTLTEGQY